MNYKYLFGKISKSQGSVSKNLYGAAIYIYVFYISASSLDKLETSVKLISQCQCYGNKTLTFEPQRNKFKKLFISSSKAILNDVAVS